VPLGAWADEAKLQVRLRACGQPVGWGGCVWEDVWRGGCGAEERGVGLGVLEGPAVTFLRTLTPYRAGRLWHQAMVRVKAPQHVGQHVSQHAGQGGAGGRLNLTPELCVRLQHAP
jgi:hypothetical protein